MKEKKIRDDLITNTNEILSATKEYISKFNMAASFSFTNNDATFKEISSNYRKLTTRLLHIISVTDTLGAKLASLTLEADKAQNDKRAAQLSKLFENYCLWKEDVASFLSASEGIFLKKEDFKYAAALNQAQIFFTATENFNKTLKS